MDIIFYFDNLYLKLINPRMMVIYSQILKLKVKVLTCTGLILFSNKITPEGVSHELLTKDKRHYILKPFELNKSSSHSHFNYDLTP